MRPQSTGIEPFSLDDAVLNNTLLSIPEADYNRYSYLLISNFNIKIFGGQSLYPQAF